MKRRTFIKASAGATLGGLSMAAFGCTGDQPAKAATRKLDHIGLQLYTVRDLMAADFEGTLEQVAAAGYDQVEFAGYFDHSAEDVKALLSRLGLAAPSAHVSLDTLKGDALNVAIEQAVTIGHKYLVMAWLPEDQRGSPNLYKQHAALFNRAGEACKKAGIQFAYHNHDFEFVSTEGQLPYDVLLSSTNPDLVAMELDLYWITKGGQDPLAYFKRYPGRFPLCHVKDMDDAGEITDVGRGHIDFAKIFAQAEKAGLKYYFVENDNPTDAIASIRTSETYLKALRF